MLKNLILTCKIFVVFLAIILISNVQCAKRGGADNRRNETYFPGEDEFMNEAADGLKQYTKELATMLFSGRKKGGGGGGGGMGMFFMRTLMDMFNATVPMMAMTVMGWMKDIMLMGAGAFMMMMYDMLKKGGDQKKIIIKLPSQPSAPEPPPQQTGYGPWEGK